MPDRSRGSPASYAHARAAAVAAAARFSIMRSRHAPRRDRNGRMKRQARRPRRGIQSIETGVRLLEALERVDGPLALKEVSAMAGMDPSSADRYLGRFPRSGWG